MHAPPVARAGLTRGALCVSFKHGSIHHHTAWCGLSRAALRDAEAGLRTWQSAMILVRRTLLAVLLRPGILTTDTVRTAASKRGVFTLLEALKISETVDPGLPSNPHHRGCIVELVFRHTLTASLAL